MIASKFKLYNNVFAWLAFAIALVTYTLTLEPSASFWDCGEYIATSAKLQVGHPTGAPLFQMMGAFFAMYTSDSSKISMMVNFMSALASAFTILFMFWTISILSLHILKIKVNELTNSQALSILGASFVGSLAFTFSDSFWFSAVEAEVYGMATFLMALLFWLGLRWEQEMHTARGDKWLVLIAYVIGLSFGVHFLGLLTIPAIVMLYYFKNYKVDFKGFIIANAVAIGILLFVFKMLLPWTMKFFSILEMFFTNSIGLPFNTGTIIAFILIVLFFYYTLNYTRKNNKVNLNTLTLAILFILMGFSSWMMLPIRANAKTVINENNPSSARELLAYYNREQYGESHLFYGPFYTEAYAGLDPENPYKDDKPKYEKNKEKGKYVIVNPNYKNNGQNLDDAHKGLLPRLWSRDNAKNYIAIIGPPEFRMIPRSEFMDNYENMLREPLDDDMRDAINGRYNEYKKAVRDMKKDYIKGRVDTDQMLEFLSAFSDVLIVEKPNFSDNMSFLWNYQLNYMYWRYFMWNFVGRQNDVQGKLDNNGHWISGITALDSRLLGMSQKDLPDDIKNNKARNVYYFLPFILGFIGLLFHYSRDPRRFYALLLFFLFTGIAILIYTNVRPFEPRERDYAVVGSFYVFALWIGLGVLSILTQLKAKKTGVVGVVLTILLAVPALMAAENWDDHDRSGRYSATDMAKNYLDSCQENAILFTIGDNDTFPLWNVQEIEEYRTDIKAINTSLFATDWYIDQMKRQTYDAAPIPSQLTHDKYVYGKRDAIIYDEKTKGIISIKDLMDWIASDDKRKQVQLQNEHWEHSFPSKKIRIPVNKENVLKYGIVDAKDAALIVPYIDIEIKGNQFAKHRMMMLDIIANNDWKRPIYFTGGSFDEAEYIWMKDYLQLDGLTYKLVPIKTALDKENPFDMGRIDADVLYKNFKKFKWTNSNDPNLYLDPQSRSNSITYRSTAARLAEALMKKGDNTKAEDVVDTIMDRFPIDQYGYYTLVEPFAELYFRLGKPEKAKAVLSELIAKYKGNLNYYATLSNEAIEVNFMDIMTDIERYRGLIGILISYDKEAAMKEKADFVMTIKRFVAVYKGAVDTDVPPIANGKRQIETPLDTLQDDSIK
jgi:hypothetical protein